jgi:hypothetical protein
MRGASQEIMGQDQPDPHAVYQEARKKIASASAEELVGIIDGLNEIIDGQQSTPVGSVLAAAEFLMGQPSVCRH